MPRILRAFAITMVAALLTTLVAGRFTLLNVLGWAAFFGGLFWEQLLRDPRPWGRCRP